MDNQNNPNSQNTNPLPQAPSTPSFTPPDSSNNPVSVSNGAPAVWPATDPGQAQPAASDNGASFGLNQPQPAVPAADPASFSGTNQPQSMPMPNNPWATPSQPSSVSAPDPVSPWAPVQTEPQPSATPAIPDEPAPAQPDTASVFTPSLAPEPATQNGSAPLNPWSQTLAPDNNPLTQQPAPAWTPPDQSFSPQEPVTATGSNPIPSPTPAEPIAPTDMGGQPAASMPADNPWNAPAQPSTQDQPASQPSWNVTAADVPPAPDTNTPPPSADSVPTDLSHLITGNAPQQSVPASAETLVVPAVNPEVPNLPAEKHKGIPIWLIGVGAGLLLLVIGASAYFILGIGQPSKPTTSLPATPAEKAAETKPVVPAAPVAESSTQPAATGSASFGTLEGGESQPATGSSSLELARQRQQAGQ